MSLGNMMPNLNVKDLTEEDIKMRFITPAIQKAGWPDESILMEKYFTDGRIIRQGHMTLRKTGNKADYLLHLNDDCPIAIVEAKDANQPVSGGLQQAIEYARILDLPLAYSSNGTAFREHNLTTGEERGVLELENEDTLELKPFSGIGSPVKIARLFGGPDAFDAAFRELETEIYKEAPKEGSNATKETWFYRMDMPEGIKHFSKTKPMLFEHTESFRTWWKRRVEIVGEDIGEKAKRFTVQELHGSGCNFDRCKFPKDDEEILPPDELIARFREECAKSDAEIEASLAKIQAALETH